MQRLHSLFPFFSLFSSSSSSFLIAKVVLLVVVVVLNESGGYLEVGVGGGAGPKTLSMVSHMVSKSSIRW